MTSAIGLVILADDGNPPTCLLPIAVHAEVTVVERVAQHRLIQTFVNAGPSRICAAYAFPLLDGAAVSGYRARFSSGREILGEARERSAAKQAFREAVSQGLRAAILEEQCADVFRTSIGSLGAGEEVEIELHFCLELPVVDGSVRLTIPSHVAPRYSPRQGVTSSDSGALAYTSTAPEASFTAKVAVEMSAGGVAAIESPTHPSIITIHSQDATKTIAEFRTIGLETDLVLTFKPACMFQPVVVREVLETSGTEALMLSLVPKFELAPQRVEVIFVLDCSGSMSGKRIDQAKRATIIFLRSLPADCFFNIVLFGSNFETLYADGSAAYDEASLQEATAYVDRISAGMGGTQILEPMRFVLSSKPMCDAQRQVILLTDGQVSNQAEVLDMLNGKGSRVFSIGIGSGVSTSLVNGVARKTNGSAAFVQDNEKLEPVCVAMLKKAVSPAISNAVLSWPASASFRSQTTPPPIYAGSVFSGFALYPCGALPDRAVVKLAGVSSVGELEWVVAVPAIARTANNSEEAILHKMFARSLIRDIEEMECNGQSDAPSYKTEAIQLSIQHSVLCSYTAFVAVEHGAVNNTERAVEVAKDALVNSRSLLFGRSAAGMQRCSVSLTRQDLESAVSWSCRAGELESAVSRLKEISRNITFDLSSHSALIQHIDEDVTHSSQVFLQSATAKFSCKKKSPYSLAVHFVDSCGKLFMSGATAFLSWTSTLFRCSADIVDRTNSTSAKERTEAGHVGCQSPSVNGLTTDPASPPAHLTDTSLPLRQRPIASGSNDVAQHSRSECLEKLLRLVRFNGSFTHSLELQGLIGIDESVTVVWAHEQWGRPVTGDVLVTALVLGCLATHFSSDQPIWELVASKATKWLDTQQREWFCKNIKSVDDLLAAATSQPRCGPMLEFV